MAKIPTLLPLISGRYTFILSAPASILVSFDSVFVEAFTTVLVGVFASIFVETLVAVFVGVLFTGATSEDCALGFCAMQAVSNNKTANNVVNSFIVLITSAGKVQKI